MGECRGEERPAKDQGDAITASRSAHSLSPSSASAAAAVRRVVWLVYKSKSVRDLNYG
jgi:hypothetical protein